MGCFGTAWGNGRIGRRASDGGVAEDMHVAEDMYVAAADGTAAGLAQSNTAEAWHALSIAEGATHTCFTGCRAYACAWRRAVEPSRYAQAPRGRNGE